ncbi:MAG: NigD-like N-terminal domain-containing protein [Prevotella sp.]|nr:NigD-like N-terminal domain-containing protein [Prevotella sp.]
MKKLSVNINRILLFAGIVSCLMLSCTTEDYETGNGEYSFMRADFVETATDSQGAFVSAVTDEGEQLMFASPFKVSWKTASDSTYRALLYYQKKDGEVTPFTVSTVSVPTVRMTSSLKSAMKTDPVTLESIWQSKQNEYINMGLLLKTGNPDESDNRHVVGMMCDTVYEHPDRYRHIRLRFYHDQHQMPEYYSSKVYVSIPMKKLPCTIARGDTVTVAVNSYEGLREKSFVY